MIYNGDPFDNPFPDEPVTRGPGRPRTRPVKEKGPVGRPRIRPLQEKSLRGRGRPRSSVSSVGDRIEREALISGSYGSKSVAASVKGLEKSVSSFQSRVVNPLAKAVAQFSQSVTKFNAYHQQYLKDQIAVARDMNETFKIFRKTAIDPVLRNLVRSQKHVALLDSAVKTVGNQSGASAYSDYGRMANAISELNKKLTVMSRTGVFAVEATDTYLKEYYKTSKSTSKFLNAVTYAAQDISEDISNLRTDLNKYLKGQRNKSVIVDQTELLKQIEKNTKGPSIGKRILSTAFASGVAFIKTAFKYNRFGTTQLLTDLFGIDMQKVRDKAFGVDEQTHKQSKLGAAVQEGFNRLGSTKAGQFFQKKGGAISKWWQETVDLEIRRYIRDQNNNLQFAIRNASSGGYGSTAQTVADTAINIGRKGKKSLGDMGKALADLPNRIVDAWNESKTKAWAKWLWEVGSVIFLNTWDRAGAYGERHVNATITNYGKKNYQGPHGGMRTTGDPVEDARRALSRAQEALDAAGGGSNIFPFRRVSEEAQLRPGTIDWSGVSKKVKSTGEKAQDYISKTFGKGYSTVSLAPDSESTISSANVSTPQKAFASLLKVNARIMGYMKKLWGKAQKPIEEAKEKGKSWFGGLGALLGGGALASFAMKNKALLKKGGKLAWLAPLVFGLPRIGAGFLGKGGSHAAARGLGATGRVLWDTFSILGNASVKHGGTGMKALGLFKNTKLGQSALGTFIRKARIASAGLGTSASSRALRGLIEFQKWGGITGGPLSLLGGGIGAARGKAIASLGGAAAKGGTRTKILADLAKAAQHQKFLEKLGVVGKGIGAVENIAGKGLGLLGKGFGTVAKTGLSVGGAVAGTTGTVLGSALTKIPSKDKVFGKLLGGAGAKIAGKLGGKAAAKAIAKQIPIIGALAGIGFGIWRFTKGQVLDGLMEIASGLLTLVPTGWGNAAALALDGTLLARDIGRAKSKSISDKDKEKVLKTFGVKATGSKENYISSAQGGGSGAIPDMANDNSGGRVSLGQRLNTAFSNAGSAIKGAAAGAVAGAKAIYKDVTGAINWGMNRHDKMHPAFMQKFVPAAEAFYKKTGKKVRVTSALRTNEDQAKLWVRANILHDPNVYMPAKPAYDTTVRIGGKDYFVKGNGNKMRTGHMVGGAVDVANWREFLPFAQQFGLSWMGQKDPVHFQINDRLPVVTSSTVAQKPSAPPNTKGTSSKAVGDGESAGVPVGPSRISDGFTGPGPAGSTDNSVSPMIQDYGIAIINNLLFR